MADLFLSGPFDYKGEGWGYAHYSYGFALDSFKKTINDTDKVMGVLSYPFNNAVVNSTIRKSNRAVQVSFLPPDVALIAPRAFNICTFAWEFDRLPSKSEERNGIFKKDYAKTLKSFDAVLTLSSYSQETLASYGIDSHVLPSAVERKPVDQDETIDDLACYELSTSENYYSNHNSIPLGSLLENTEYSQRFLYILNPHDIRKNFGNLVTAFVKFREDYPDAILILKMTAQGDLGKLQQTAFRREFPVFEDTLFENVYFIPQKLTDSKLQMLMESCEKYVSPSRAEGQNLPLCEAMVSDRVCIAPDHTSMKDYINHDSAIILDHHPWMIDETTHKYKDFWGFSWYSVPEDTILSALKKSMKLTSGQKRTMIASAKNNVEAFCSPKAVLEKWQKIKLQLRLD
jgi:hypothetical protein